MKKIALRTILFFVFTIFCCSTMAWAEEVESEAGKIEVILSQENNMQKAKITFEGANNLQAISTVNAFFTEVTFPGWLGLVDKEAGGSGNFANEPSPSTVAFWKTGGNVKEIFFDRPVSAVSFHYNSYYPVIMKGFNSSGEELICVEGEKNWNKGIGGDPLGDFNLFEPLSIKLQDNVISKVQVISNADRIVIDDLLLTRVITMDEIINDFNYLKLNKGQRNSLKVKLESIQKQLEKGKEYAIKNVINELNALVKTGKISSKDVMPLLMELEYLY